MPFATNPGDGVRTYYEVEGEGPTLFLYPGATLSHHVMSESGYTDAFGGSHRIILFDPRGIGQSDKPHNSSAYTLDRLVGDVVAVLDDLNIQRTHFLGYSRGGWVGFGLATFAAERLTSFIAGGMHPYPRDVARNIDDMSAVVTFLETTFGPVPPNTRADLLASDVEALNAANRGVGESVSLAPVLSDITAPCFLYCGKDDAAHDDAMKAASEIPNASFLSLHGLNHITAGGAQVQFVFPHLRAFLSRIEAERE